MSLILPGSRAYKKLLNQSVAKTTDEQRGVLYPYLRQALVVAIDASTLSCTIELGGDSTVDIGGVKVLHDYVPRINDIVWVLQNGTSYLIVGAQDTKTPACQIRSDNEPVTTAGAASITFDFAGGTADIETHSGMSDIANDRIVIPWPGRYLVGAQVRHVGNSPSANCKRMAYISKNAGTTGILPVWEETGTISPFEAEWFTMSVILDLVANDNISLRIKGGLTGEVDVRWGDGTNGFQHNETKLWVVYQG
jgi:hypothetical protein